jgi:hypothetical protein
MTATQKRWPPTLPRPPEDSTLARARRLPEAAGQILAMLRAGRLTRPQRLAPVGASASTRRSTDPPIEHTIEDYQVDGALGVLTKAQLSTGFRRSSMEKTTRVINREIHPKFSSAHPVNHVSALHSCLPVAKISVPQNLCPRLRTRSRRVCTSCPHRRPRSDLVPGVAARENVRAIG